MKMEGMVDDVDIVEDCGQKCIHNWDSKLTKDDESVANLNIVVLELQCDSLDKEDNFCQNIDGEMDF